MLFFIIKIDVLGMCFFCKLCLIIVFICCCELLVNCVFVLLFNVICIVIEMVIKMIIEMDRKYSFLVVINVFFYMLNLFKCLMRFILLY